MYGYVRKVDSYPSCHPENIVGDRSAPVTINGNSLWIVWIWRARDRMWTPRPGSHAQEMVHRPTLIGVYLQWSNQGLSGDPESLLEVWSGIRRCPKENHNKSRPSKAVKRQGGYILITLWQTNIAIENGPYWPIDSEFSHWKWWFSIVYSEFSHKNGDFP